MSIFRRLRVDDIPISTDMEGNDIANVRLRWTSVIGSLIVQIIVSAIPSIYGVVLSNNINKNSSDSKIWSENFTLAPLLMIAFWTITDPLTDAILKLAAIPQFISLIGVTLLTIGLIASSYLASGGVAAYLASLSAGVVMGIGASLAILQCEHCLREFYVYRPSLASAFRTVAYGSGLLIVPVFSQVILESNTYPTGLMRLSTILMPAALATLLLRSTRRRSPTSSPYRLLLTEESSGRIGSFTNGRPSGSGDANSRDPPNFEGHGNEAYSYEDVGHYDVESRSTTRNKVTTGWRKYCKLMRTTDFCGMLFSYAGHKGVYLLSYVIVPPLMSAKVGDNYKFLVVLWLILLGMGIVVSGVGLYFWDQNSARTRSIIYGCSTWITAVTMIGMTFISAYFLFALCALLTGLCIGVILSSQDSLMTECFGQSQVHRVRKVLSLLTGIFLLLFSLVENPITCLQIIAGLQFVSGSYWVLTPTFSTIRSNIRR